MTILNGQYGKGMEINNWKVIGGSGDFGPPKYARQTGNVYRMTEYTEIEGCTLTS